MCKPKRFEWRNANNRDLAASTASTTLAFVGITQGKGERAKWCGLTSGAKESGVEDTIEQCQAAAQAWFDDLWASESET